MSSIVTICAFALLLLYYVTQAGKIQVKGVYCRDPETGKLHPPNTTWTSRTFCGRYTCKLRKQNATDINQTPVRQINITDIHINNENASENQTETKENVAKIESKEVMFRDSSNNVNIISKDNVKKFSLDNLKNIELDTSKKEGDRFLTQQEINALTDLLHAVKKSDLEAIVEIYNLAQDIYKEVDNTPDEKILEETLKDYQNKVSNIYNDKVRQSGDKVSYWREPLNLVNSRTMVLEVADPTSKPAFIGSPQYKEIAQDIAYEGSNILPVEAPQNHANPLPPRHHLNGAVYGNDFANLPYYHPMSNFQRTSSYVHPFSFYHNVPSEYKKPCKFHSKANTNLPAQVPWFSGIPIQRPTSEIQRRDSKNQEPVRLPFPLAYIHRPNATIPQYANPYFTGDPWTIFNLYNQHPASYIASYVSKIPQSAYINPNLNVEAKEKDEKPVSEINELEKQIKERPIWQTDEIPAEVLDEVRANVVVKSKLFPLKHKLKLERVGRVTKVEKSRDKREVEVKIDRTATEERETEDLAGDVQYEAYIEKSMCSSDTTEPGFFSLGNVSQPFPACCPQRIGKNR